ncbi:MAG TPA: hypothetical protein VGN20_06085 [Mucilaginibacter sp.]|jgi:hypothetical protein
MESLNELNASALRDDRQRIRLINHNHEPLALEAATPQQLAQAYIKHVANIYEINAAMLSNLPLQLESEMTDETASFRFLEEKAMPGSTVISFVQTYFGLPVRYAGIDIVMLSKPLRVLSSSTTFYYDIKVKQPSADRVKEFKGITEPALLKILFTAEKSQAKQRITINKKRLVIFKYNADNRQFTPDEKTKKRGDKKFFIPPTIPLSKVPDTITDGGFYVSLEIYFSMEVPGYGLVNWLVIIDVETGTVLYLEALIDGANGYVFLTDPVTKSGNSANSPSSSDATLNTFRDNVVLQGLNAPVAGSQALSGDLVFVSSTLATPPTETSPYNFYYNARTDNFSAVNAYNNCDRFFRMISDMGFNQSVYFDGTSFPVLTNHRWGSTVNANCAGNAAGNGIGQVNFELADSSNTTNPLGSACDWRTVLHEMGGHGILYDHINSANLGFSHSQGDSFAAIINDAISAITGSDRFITFPFTLFWDEDFVTRRHDRDVPSGWGWGGVNDNYTTSPYRGYKSEQVLSTTLFRFYRSIGGDAADPNQKIFASRFASYLIFNAVGLLTPTSAAAIPKTSQTDYVPVTDYEQKLESADAPDWVSTNPAETNAGGAYYKVIRWAFEKQGLFRGSGDPVTSEGRPPAVDVYIDDGRGGEYPYQPNHWSCQDIWNRLSADGGTTHLEPIVGQTNYAYVRVKNRGSQQATNVIVHGFHCFPSVGLTYPDDWQPMTDALLVGGNIAANDSVGEIVGPFQWTPSQVGHECMFFAVYATGDPSNIDGRIRSSIPEWRLVPNDNNIGQRNVSPVPGGGGAPPFRDAMNMRPFWLYNPLGREAEINLEVSMPGFLTELGWKLSFATAGGSKFNLKPGIKKEILLSINEGKEFTKDNVLQNAHDSIITVTAYADGIIIGGMSYQVDPNMKKSNVDNSGGGISKGGDCDIAKEILKCIKTEKVKSVHIRKINLDINFTNDEECE